MKKTTLLNSEVSYVIAKLGHFDALTVCDAGLPIPAGTQRIDLAVSKGIPGFMDTVRAIAAEMEIDSVEIAEEMRSASPALHEELLAALRRLSEDITVTHVPHESFKANTKNSVAIVRTGEFTPYANVTLKSGVVF
ncbi:D-ribose pyranase [Pseudodesulfovibrio tunisiensis]|uniref:D-ribose pyranase n=1 Tax=Pseudodesulfovibrio tunisiensis TaxID=463192 RepID=UPI001FB319C3|nr:D-ribose pyranase [Pseudodesulfovibrio tunisiensis]